MAHDRESSESDPLLAFLRRQEPGLKRVFRRFAIPPPEAERILEDAFMTLVYRFDHLARPDRWLKRTVRGRCAAYWRRRQEELLALEPEIHHWLEDPEADAAERAARRRQLEDDIEALPRACRAPLKGHFGLGGPPGPAPQRCLRTLFRRWVRLLLSPP